MSTEPGSCTILFADVAGSVRLFETLGDARARSAIAQCLGTLGHITRINQGKVIKTLGDEIMSTFPDADTGVRAAIEMQNETASALFEGLQIHLRVGLHHGPVIEENDDVFGDAVNLAKRIGDLSRADEILTTRATFDLLDILNRQFTRRIDRTEVKGKSEAIEIFQVMWNTGDDATFIASAAHNTLANAATQKPAMLKLRWSHGEKTVFADDEAISIGRGLQADIQIPSQLASRVHCTIDTARLKFVLTDQSLNGTYVVNEAGETLSLKRDKLPLTGSGSISLGSPPDENPDGLLHYEVVKNAD